MIRTGMRDAWVRLGLLAIILLGTIVYVLVRAFGGAELVNVTVTPAGRVITFHDIRVWVLAALLAAIASLLNWGVAERRVARLAKALRQERSARQAESGDRVSRVVAAGEEERLREELAVERARYADLEAAWRSEHEWGRELRRRVLEAGHAGGPPGPARAGGPPGAEAVAAALLELTMQLVEAERGALLADRGGLSTVAFAGFTTDPLGDVAADPLGGEAVRGVAEAALRRGSPVRQDVEGASEARCLLAIPVCALDARAGVIVCADRPGGFDALDDDVLEAVGEQAGFVLASARWAGGGGWAGGLAGGGGRAGCGGRAG